MGRTTGPTLVSPDGGGGGTIQQADIGGPGGGGNVGSLVIRTPGAVDLTKLTLAALVLAVYMTLG